MFIISPDSPTCQNRKIRVDLYLTVCLRLCQNPGANSVFFYNIGHSCIFQNRYILKPFNLGKKLTRNLFSCNIRMVQDSGSGMRALPRIGETVFAALKLHSISNQVVYDFPGAPYHNIHRLPAVLVMPCLHCIFKITVVIILVPENADTALGQKRITALHIRFGKHQDLLIPRQIQRTE